MSGLSTTCPYCQAPVNARGVTCGSPTCRRLRANERTRLKYHNRPKVEPLPGLYKCYKCRRLLPHTAMVRARRATGVGDICRTCNYAKTTAWFNANAERRRAYKTLWQRRYRERYNGLTKREVMAAAESLRTGFGR